MFWSSAPGTVETISSRPGRAASMPAVEVSFSFTYTAESVCSAGGTLRSKRSWVISQPGPRTGNRVS